MWTPVQEAHSPRTGTIRRAVTSFLNGLKTRVLANAPVNDVKGHADFGTNKLVVTALRPGPYASGISVDMIDPGATGAFSVDVDEDNNVTVYLAYVGAGVTTTYLEVQTAFNAHSIIKTLLVASAGTGDVVADEGPKTLAGGVLGTPGEEGEIAVKGDGSRFYLCEVSNGLITWYEATFTKVS